MARQTRDQWIRDVLLDTTKDGECTAISLVHIVAGSGEREIFTLKIGGPQNPKELADLFWQKANDYAGEIPGVQTFNLLAFYANRHDCQARKPFVVQGEPVEQGQLATEAPTGSGIVQQSMRHNEAFVQITLRHTAAMIDASARMVERLATHNERLMEENRDAYGIVKEVMLAQVTSRNDHELKMLQFQRDSQERAKWLAYGPALINSLLNREVFPQATEDTSLIESIIESLTEDDISKLASSGIIKPEIWGPLAKRMTKSLAAKRKAHEEMRQLTNGVDPEHELS